MTKILSTKAKLAALLLVVATFAAVIAIAVGQPAWAQASAFGSSYLRRHFARRINQRVRHRPAGVPATTTPATTTAATTAAATTTATTAASTTTTAASTTATTKASTTATPMTTTPMTTTPETTKPMTTTPMTTTPMTTTPMTTTPMTTTPTCQACEQPITVPSALPTASTCGFDGAPAGGCGCTACDALAQSSTTCQYVNADAPGGVSGSNCYVVNTGVTVGAVTFAGPTSAQKCLAVRGGTLSNAVASSTVDGPSCIVLMPGSTVNRQLFGGSANGQTLINHNGVINDLIDLGSGDNTIVGAGSSAAFNEPSGFPIVARGGADTLLLVDGVTVTGSVFMGDGNDFVRVDNAQISGGIDLRNGDDSLTVTSSTVGPGGAGTALVDNTENSCLVVENSVINGLIVMRTGDTDQCHIRDTTATSVSGCEAPIASCGGAPICDPAITGC